ncbi:MAG TPA: enterohemolysin [Leclercia adecarboxylata]|nr:enterohemolysin [Leclercia adecarboxylata]HCQ07867.1 enterohemolysin [Leclercia adecarboxylata]
MSTAISTNENKTQLIDNISILTNGELFERLRTLSVVMANSGAFVPDHFRGKPDACMAVVMQAARWGMDPFAVAQKTHIISGSLGYEAQLINAVITKMSPTKDRLHYDWFGSWENIVGRFVKKTSSKGNEYLAPGWDLKDEAGVGVRVWATMKGEDEPRELVLMLSQAQVRNSTLWASDPRQQLAYLGVKRWASLYCPDVILGVNSVDEVEQRTEKEINPAPAQRVSLADIKGDTVTHTHSAQESAANIDGLADDFRDRIEAAQDVDSASAVRADIETAKAALGSTLYTELKNKAVKRYHLADQRNKVEAAINSLPQSGEPGAAEAFEEAERVLAAAKRHLGDELHDKFSITLADMKPEYVA